MIKEKIVKISRKIKNIIIGTYYNITNKQKGLSIYRMSLCNKCPHKKDLFGGICEICGCILESKTRVLEERCPKKEW